MNLLKNRQFYPTFWTQFLAAFNDNFFKNAVIILIIFQNWSLLGMSSSQLIGFSSAIFILPFFLFSSFAANLSNKYAKHTITKNLKLLELFIMLIGTFGLIFHHVAILQICLFLLGTQASLYGPIKYSILPELMHEDHLTEANAFIEAGTFLAILLGTICGGLLINMSNGVVLVSAISVGCAVLGYIFSLKIPSLKEVNSNQSLDLNIIKSTFNIIKESKQKNNLFMTIMAISWFWFLGAFILTLLPILTKTVLMGNDSLITLFLALFSIGVAVGAIFSDKIAKGKMELGLIPVGSIGMTVSLFFMYLSLKSFNVSSALDVSSFLEISTSYGFLASLITFSFFGGIYSIPLYTYLQVKSSKEERSNMIASNNILNALFMVVSSVMIMGLGVMKVSIPHMFFIIFILNIFASIYTYKYMPEFMLRFISYCLTHFIYKIEVNNKEELNKNPSFILTSNHVSFVDWLIVSSVVDRPIQFVMHYSFYQLPIIKYLCKDGKAICIAGKNEKPEYYETAFKEINQALSHESIVCIFPEGKITQDGNINVFKSGINQISADNINIPIVPIAITNLYGSAFSRKNSNNFGKRLLSLISNFRKRIIINVGESIIPTEQNKDVSISSILEEKTKELMTK